MENDELLDKIQVMFLALEMRMDRRFDAMERRLDSMDRKLTLHAGVLSQIVKWSDLMEREVSRVSNELAEVQDRLAKLENPNAA